jgi:hypothetical protein
MGPYTGLSSDGPEIGLGLGIPGPSGIIPTRPSACPLLGPGSALSGPGAVFGSGPALEAGPGSAYEAGPDVAYKATS